MALWLVRAGRHGDYEQQFLDDNRIYLTWAGIKCDLSKIVKRDEIKQKLREQLPDSSEGKISNGSGQIWAFVQRMKVGDWIVVPSKKKQAIHIGEIIGEYCYAQSNGSLSQYRKVKWIETDVPRSNFDQDLLYSFGAFMTICQIKRNDAENRIKAMAKNGWKSTPLPPDIDVKNNDDDIEDTENSVDLEQIARDQIAKLIIAQFKGHGMARLVNAILEAQGYTTHVSPEGPDKGVDILAAPGPLGFGTPRICVQVKSTEGPLERTVLDQLMGVMNKFGAEQGLLVSWGGFKHSFDSEKAGQFFSVRLWDQAELIDQLLENYDKLDEDLRAELPLKRIWTMAVQEDQ